VIFTSPVANAAPNELTRQFCLNIKTMARQAKEARELGSSQFDLERNVAEMTEQYEGTPNLDQVIRISNAVIKAAWLTDDDPDAYSELVHETCLDTITLVP
jgi:hypothetical protein